MNRIIADVIGLVMGDLKNGFTAFRKGIVSSMCLLLIWFFIFLLVHLSSLDLSPRVETLLDMGTGSEITPMLEST